MKDEEIVKGKKGTKDTVKKYLDKQCFLDKMSVYNKTGQMKGLFPTVKFKSALNQICGPMCYKIVICWCRSQMGRIV